jgi:hypothetical protein
VKVLSGCIILAIALLTGCSPRSLDGSDIPVKQFKHEWEYVTNAEVLQAVEAAQSLVTLPDKVAANLGDKDGDVAYSCSNPRKTAKPAVSGFFGECTYGNPAAKRLAVLYGDASAGMWSSALELIAFKRDWKFKMYSLGGCSVADLPQMSMDTNAPNTECDNFRAAAITRIRELHPDLIIVSAESPFRLADGSAATPDQFQDGWASAFVALGAPNTKLAAIEPIPRWQNNSPRCLDENRNNVQVCSASPEELWGTDIEIAQQAAAAANQVLWVPTRQWVCAALCENVIAGKQVYRDQSNFTRTYVVYLAGALDEALEPVLR